MADYEQIDPVAVEKILADALNNASVGNTNGDWGQVAIAAAITKLAIAVEKLEPQQEYDEDYE
ncbi:hypothetical protein ADL26_07930 [Thermoactinomyces vulgaris]|nr:hypothetical protein ADL26_07930 [Thermoactinomyces vulgaris]